MPDYNKAIGLLCPDDDNGQRFHGNDYYSGTEKGREIVNIVAAGRGNGRSRNEIARALNEAGYQMANPMYDKHGKPISRFSYQDIYQIERNHVWRRGIRNKV